MGKEMTVDEALVYLKGAAVTKEDKTGDAIRFAITELEWRQAVDELCTSRNFENQIRGLGKILEKLYEKVDAIAGEDEQTKAQILLTIAADVMHDVPEKLRDEFFRNYSKIHKEVEDVLRESVGEIK